jgi:hypothetical protein
LVFKFLRARRDVHEEPDRRQDIIRRRPIDLLHDLQRLQTITQGEESGVSEHGDAFVGAWGMRARM